MSKRRRLWSQHPAVPTPVAAHLGLGHRQATGPRGGAMAPPQAPGPLFQVCWPSLTALPGQGARPEGGSSGVLAGPQVCTEPGCREAQGRPADARATHPPLQVQVRGRSSTRPTGPLETAGTVSSVPAPTSTPVKPSVTATWRHSCAALRLQVGPALRWLHPRQVQPGPSPACGDMGL